MKHIIFCFILCLIVTQPLCAARKNITPMVRDPYVSALVIEADSGKTLISENASATIYPASVLKLMVLMIILEQIEQNRLQLDDMVQVTVEAAKMGGSQVYLDPKEQFSVEDLLYALMVQSANDAAVALATHIAGSKSGFVALMNQRAAQLGMKNTHFHSVHGLPPSKNQEVDVTTAEDLAIISRELAKKPEAFTYTSTRTRDFRDGKFVMRTHNHLLEDVHGCDGFKTGFFQAGGFSIVATAKRRGVRIISIVLGSENRKVRDAKARELLEKGFSMIPPKPAKGTTTKIADSSGKPDTKKESTPSSTTRSKSASLPSQLASGIESGIAWKTFFSGVVTGMIIYAIFSFLISRRKRRKYTRYSR